MATIKKCDICGKTFDFGFRISVNLKGGMSFTNISKYRYELGDKDICLKCYKKMKKIAEVYSNANKLEKDLCD